MRTDIQYVLKPLSFNLHNKNENIWPKIWPNYAKFYSERHQTTTPPICRLDILDIQLFQRIATNYFLNFLLKIRIENAKKCNIKFENVGLTDRQTDRRSWF